MYKLIAFNLGGTLAYTSEEIYNAHRVACVALKINLSENSLDSVIGGALIDIYQERFGLNINEARKALDIYRERYQNYGIYQTAIYPGIEELLAKLQGMFFSWCCYTKKRRLCSSSVI